jgi:hypothetical protein
MGFEQRAHRLFDGAERRHRPAERGAVAVRARELVGACRGDEDAAGLLGLLAHGQGLGRQDAAGEEARALLLRRLLHLAHGGGGLAFGVEQRVGQGAVQGLAVLLDGELHPQVCVLAVGRERARHGHGAAELDRILGLGPGAGAQAEGCGQCAERGKLQEVTTLHEGLRGVGTGWGLCQSTLHANPLGHALTLLVHIYSDK